jgi:transposase
LPYGRSPIGQRVFDEKPTNKGQRVSMVGAMSADGMKTAMTFEGTMNTAVFLYFLQHFLCPLLKAGDVVIMDNAPVHKNDEVKTLIEATGATLLYLPPYSPELNPIELAWNKIKQLLRKQKARTLDSLYLAYANALKLISVHDAKGFVKHAMSFAI